MPSSPRQYEFARLNVNYTVTSKRKLKLLVDSGVVSGWDDPRMPTIAGMRRRGYTPAALRHFCEEVGTSRSDGVVDVAMLESAVRNDLNVTAPRVMAVLNPLKLQITNLEAPEVLLVANHPADDTQGKREVQLGPEIWIDKDDFRQEANKKFKRLVLGKRVRLRGGYVIEAERCDVDADGEVTAVYALIVPQPWVKIRTTVLRLRASSIGLMLRPVSRQKLEVTIVCSLRKTHQKQITWMM